MKEKRSGARQNEGARVPANTIYQIVRREGEEELSRPLLSLWWSGIAAGITISTSVITEALLHLALPDTPWRPLLVNFGYCVGFLIVVLGRLQLFTESTITVVLPLLAEFSSRSLRRVLSLWGIVLVANLTGTLTAAAFMDIIGFMTSAQLAAIHEISRPLLQKSWWDTLLHSVPAGFYIAAMVWMLPNAKGFAIWVIVVATYLIALGEFSHVIVNSVNAFVLVLGGDVGFSFLYEFLLPVLVGNVIGGAFLFSLLAYGQVRGEID